MTNYAAPTEAEFRRIGRASKTAALLSLLGSLMIGGGLLFSAYKLSRAEEDRQEVVAQLGQASQQLLALRGELTDTQRTLAAERQALEQSRCALGQSRYAIEAFHQRDYASAIQLYSEALRCDPNNAYLLNLQAYSMFKAGQVAEAIRTQQHSLQVDPAYAWGYFDLARFQCAVHSFDRANAARMKAISLRPELANVMKQDGEFQRLCAQILR